MVNRQAFDDAAYLADWKRANGNPPFTHPTMRIDPTPYLIGRVRRRRPRRAAGRTPCARRPARSPASDSLGAAAGRDRDQHAGREPVPVRSDVRHRVRLALPPGRARGQRDDAADDRHPDVGRGRQLPGGLPRPRRASPGAWSTSTGSTTPRASPTPRSRARRRTRAPNLWERINNGNGDWAVQIIYNVGDRVFFGGHVYQALQQNQATNANRPDVAPAVWQLVF